MFIKKGLHKLNWMERMHRSAQTESVCRISVHYDLKHKHVFDNKKNQQQQRWRWSKNENIKIYMHRAHANRTHIIPIAIAQHRLSVDVNLFLLHFSSISLARSVATIHNALAASFFYLFCNYIQRAFLFSK